MSRRAAIIGLGARGQVWARVFQDAGWVVTGFDPDPTLSESSVDWKKQTTISGAVAGADWVVCCVPDRLDLMQMIVQRAQAEAPENAVVAVSSRRYDPEAVQNCAIRPRHVVLLKEVDGTGPELGLTLRNPQDVKVSVLATLSEVLPAIGTMADDEPESQSTEARSA